MENSNEPDKTLESDPLDINELATLNEDISPEFIEQLQSQVVQNANIFTGDTSSENARLFEEVSISQKEESTASKTKIDINDNIDDNFMKKYKARLNKQKMDVATDTNTDVLKSSTPQIQQTDSEAESSEESTEISNFNEEINTPQTMPKEETVKNNIQAVENNKSDSAILPINEITTISGGNITERPLTPEQQKYTEELDLLDQNVKYSKYIIYIDPENKEFIDSLTVKERKNLINRIIREQDNVVITKRKLGNIQSIIRHVFVAIITIAIAIPVTYIIINASLEASINNYRRSQGMFQTLYREHGKIKTNINMH